MTDYKSAVKDIKDAFDKMDYPAGFVAAFDQLECLAAHRGRETFLVSRKLDGRLCIAKCYEKAVFDLSQGDDVLQNIQHDGLPAMLGSFANETMLCVVREYIAGTPLSAYARGNDLKQDEVVGICVQLADILIFLHEQTPSVIHRDIKPENIIVRPDGRVALIDFDTARTFKQGADSDTFFFGTKGYAPPEQYGFRQTDCRADIYSFGVLLRFLLTDSVRDNKKIRLYRPLQVIIDRCTAFAPEKRYPNMRAVKNALTAANPRTQALRAGAIAGVAILTAVLLAASGLSLYRRLTYNPFTDGTIIPLVMPDEQRQEEATAYLRQKYGAGFFDERTAYFTVGYLKDVLIEVYGMDEDYVRISSPLEPPQENPEHFLPWSLDDAQYVDRNDLAYYVTKVYWPEVVADWSSLREETGEYPGSLVAVRWCEAHGILIGVNRPRDVSCGEAAIAFANADKVFTALQDAP